MSLRSLTDKSLLSRTQELTRRERSVTLLVLLHLNEIERRRLHLKHGYASMFDYCTSGLGYSASAAGRRIQTARCVARYPEIRRLLASNEVNVSTVAQVSRILTAANKDAVLARIRGKSQREVEAIVAEFEPRAKTPRDRVRTVVVRVPAPAAPRVELAAATRAASPASADAAAEVGSLPLADANSSIDAPLVAAHDGSSRHAALDAACLEKAHTLRRHTVLQFSASDGFMAKLEKVRSLAWHRLPANASLEQVFELALDVMIEKNDPSRRAARRELAAARRNDKKEKQENAVQPANMNGKSRTANVKSRTKAKPQQLPTRATPVTGVRYIAPAIRDRVYVRDEGQCTFEAPDGRRCASTRGLQIDHIRPVALGGEGEDENLRVLCAYHNRLEAERVLGPLYEGPPRIEGRARPRNGSLTPANSYRAAPALAGDSTPFMVSTTRSKSPVA